MTFQVWNSPDESRPEPKVSLACSGHACITVVTNKIIQKSSWLHLNDLTITKYPRGYQAVASGNACRTMQEPGCRMMMYIGTAVM
jgi:hypothetical protein